MNSKILIFAAVSAALAIGGCATAPTTTAGGSVGAFAFDCKKKSCDVPARYHLPGAIVVPEVIEVDASLADTVTITWRLSSFLLAKFDPLKGIDAPKPFTCAPVKDTDNAYQCTATGLAKGEYKYTVTLIKGILPPWPLDPVIRNGN